MSRSSSSSFVCVIIRYKNTGSGVSSNTPSSAEKLRSLAKIRMRTLGRSKRIMFCQDFSEGESIKGKSRHVPITSVELKILDPITLPAARTPSPEDAL